MKVGDLIRWRNSRSPFIEFGLVVEIYEESIKVVDLDGDCYLQTDWWKMQDWIIAEESP